MTRENFKDNANIIAILVVVAVISVFGAFTVVRDTWRDGQSQISQQILDESISKTGPGQFAVENFTACKKAGSVFSSPASDAKCISETVSGAEKLKGSTFSAKVTHELAAWLEQSKKLGVQ